MINVTKTYLPDLDKYQEYVKSIFESGWITNNGQYVLELEKRLEEYLGVKNIILVSNGTLALQVAYKLLDLKNDVITTPFSFVATTSSLVWEGLNPVFSDIDRNSFCLDSSKIEEKITNKTSGIVPVHVFGNPCNVEEIDKISKKHNLKVIYDAAHAFGVQYKGESILNYGDISVLSFHATKIFHTIEGGALIINDDDTYVKAKKMINFGIGGSGIIEYLGINAKMNEFQAAMGLCVLQNIDEIICQRKNIYNRYLNIFKNYQNVNLQKYTDNAENNYSYFPIVFETENKLLDIKKNMEKTGVYPRRYFHPSLDNLKYVHSEQMGKSNDISNRILCLPIGQDVTNEIQDNIINIIISCLEL